jgi:putative endonuclease
MTTKTQLLGRYGEEQAARYLENKGYQILDRNARTAAGEVDIVATDGGTLVFVEVKTRSTNFSGHPLQAITPRKVATIRRVAAGWCATHKVTNTQVRFDAVSVLIASGRLTFEHLLQVC